MVIVMLFITVVEYDKAKLVKGKVLKMRSGETPFQASMSLLLVESHGMYVIRPATGYNNI